MDWVRMRCESTRAQVVSTGNVGPCCAIYGIINGTSEVLTTENETKGAPNAPAETRPKKFVPSVDSY